MIVVKIFGGLGNQLFQYSSAKALANRHNTELMLDLSWFNSPQKNNTIRKYELSKFQINALVANFEKQIFDFTPAQMLKNIFKKNPNKFKYFKERKFGFTEEFYNLPDNTYLMGYWQSYKFFESNRQDLIKELSKINDCNYECDEFVKKLHSINSVAVHVRRGDYVTNSSAAKFHGTCSIEYYLNAINLLRKIVDKPQFYLFSDDMDWVRMNINFGDDIHYVKSAYPQDAQHDFLLMRQCKHFIIANSTYSWWPAWLGSDAEKIVIAPENWFIKKIDTKSLFPESWILL